MVQRWLCRVGDDSVDPTTFELMCKLEQQLQKWDREVAEEAPVREHQGAALRAELTALKT